MKESVIARCASRDIYLIIAFKMRFTAIPLHATPINFFVQAFCTTSINNQARKGYRLVLSTYHTGEPRPGQLVTKITAEPAGSAKFSR